MKKSFKIFTVLLILTLIFIYLQSFLPPSVSDHGSGRITQLIKNIFTFLSFLTNSVIRKLAHVFEHSVLGFELAFLFRKKDGKWKYLLPLNTGFISAFIDESIQMFTGRGPAILDVWIDFSGILIGIIICSVIMHFIEKKKQ